jgi:carboxymethylenebutenolidase
MNSPTTERDEVSIDGEPGATPMRGYLARPGSPGRRPAIIVAHELFAVNPDIRGVVDALADLGYVAIAPEFYHRSAPAGTWLERDEAGRRRGFELLNRLTREGVVQDVRETIRYLAGRDDCSGAIGMLGFSMGGHIAYLAATQLDLVATAVLYGGWLAGRDIPLSQPEPTLTLTPGIASRGGRILYAVGGKDALIDAAQVKAIDAALSDAAVAHEIAVYPDAQHAFFWEGTASFDRGSRDRAWERLRDFFASAFGNGVRG